MKLLVVAPYFYPKTGGLENYAFNIAKGLKRECGWDVSVVCANHNERKYVEETIEGMKIYRLPYWFKFSNTPINPFWFSDLKKIVEKEKPDVINAHTPVPFIADVAGLIAKNKDIKFVLTYHAGTLLKGNVVDLFARLYQIILERATLENADKIIAVSPLVRKALFKHKKKIEVISPGVDLGLFRENNHCAKSGILFVGQLSKAHAWKGLDYLLHAIKLLGNSTVKLLVVGDGDYLGHYAKMAQKLGIKKQVQFLGWLHGKDLVEVYQKSKVLVLPSISDAEGFGMVVVEAMACGTPVIGTTCGGIPYIIQNGETGLLVEPSDPIQLANAVKEILSNKEFADKLRKNALRDVKSRFSWVGRIAETNLLYKQLMLREK